MQNTTQHAKATPSTDFASAVCDAASRSTLTDTVLQCKQLAVQPIDDIDVIPKDALQSGGTQLDESAASLQ